jgi:hypothetical protein
MKPELAALCRRDFVTFGKKMVKEEIGEISEYIDVVLFYLSSFLISGNRLMVNLPPRSLKTFLCSVCAAAWYLGNNPKGKVIVATYSEALAATIVSQLRRMMKSPTYQKIFAVRIAKGQERSLFVGTTSGGQLHAISLAGGGITGFGADFIIIDDPVSAHEAGNASKMERAIIFTETELRTRFNKPSKEKLLYVGHRLAKNDLCAYLLEQDEWDLLALPLVADEKASYPRADGEWMRKRGDILRNDEYSPKAIKRMRKLKHFHFLYRKLKARKAHSA